MPDTFLAAQRSKLPRVARTLRDSKQVRFMAVGGFNTAFGYTSFVVLQKTVGRIAHYLLVLVLAHVISVLVAFVGYRVIVFRVQGQVLADLMRFWSVYASILAVNLVALPLLVEVLGLPVLLAQGIFALLSAVMSYLAHGRFSFERPGTEADN